MNDSAQHKKILIISSCFPADPGKRTLMNEFADEALSLGLDVDVIVMEWREVDRSDNFIAAPIPNGMRVYRYAPLLLPFLGKTLAMMAKWLGSSLKAVPRTLHLLFTNKYDVIVVQSPSSAWAPVLLATRLCSGRKYLIQWDFTPYAQKAIGMMSDGPAFRGLLWLESALIRGFDVIGCMSEMNIAFLKKHYSIKSKQRVEILPIWGEANFPAHGDREIIRRKYGLPQDKKIAVFGGTLSKGRGIDDILSVARLASVSASDLVFLIIGNGPIKDEVDAAAAELGNVLVKSAIPKHDYLDLLGACDCGIVATERDTGVPTFPSKTLDYFRTLTPVVASVEDSTDYGDFLRSENAGSVVEAGDHNGLLKAIVAVVTDGDTRAVMVDRGRKLMQNYFNVKFVVDRVLKL
jgi:glycosyltransferase involved in cell wall biosynthesis